MRYVPVNCIREGMIIGKKLMGKNGELLLNTGAAIYTAYIRKIKALGYSGVYIDDELTQEIEIIEIISEDLRIKTVKTVKETFASIGNSTSFEKHFDDLCSIVSNIVDDVLENKDAMINMLDLKTFDDYTFSHCTNVAVLTLVIGVSMGLNKIELRKLGLAAILHDIGKVFIPKTILNKPGKLTDNEFEVIQSHSIKGYRYLRGNYDIPVSSYIGVLQHHEKFNGTGYPEQLSGEQIHLFGRIISITDVYDALTSCRPYRKAMLPSEAFEYILANGGIHFDPVIVENFTKKVAPYPVGMGVRLSNADVGIVVENYSDTSIRPKLKIIKHGHEEVAPYILDLRNNSDSYNITIVGLEEDLSK